ncbi:DUF4347 domain-containing protein [Sulfurimonas sp. RIFOXYB12_FULL_35_9]|uniref:DUF4347 domain-containing protein n=1 Tax=Sulfurimonas sp. RIFOXYB12_FULL_35_9 TaxID=1802256 RepID=UPI0008B7E275|nr:DUF4347 domain-containing protein [Sulfurimonas sp. RIFOXYB12_FULL_35_9]OHE06177.1 MAG: hypothetical protein A2345_05810 [Sulfurimonas sp. RIFOXYB12_FULL_35_9]
MTLSILFSHGASGSLDLGNITLDNQTLQNYHEILAQIGSSLSQNGDILLYGCNVAEGQAGVEFISKLSQATGADIAASDDFSGASDKGGDWVLEAVNGSVESTALTLSAYSHLLGGPSANFTMETAFTSGYVIDVNDLTIDINGAGPERIKISTPTALQWSNPAEEGFNSYGYNNFQAEPRTATITYDVDGDGFDDPFNLNSMVFLDPDGESQTWKIKPNGNDAGAENFTLTGDGTNLAYATFTPANAANFTNLTSVVLEHLTGSASIGVDDFDIVAYAGSATAPEITVNLFMSEIADGGVSTFDDTDVGDTPGMIRYSIINDGDADLNISAITITGDSEFTLGTLTVNDVETTVIPVGEEARIEVYFTPTANGIRTAEISIASDDSDENPFNISIDGLGVLNVADNTAPENTISATYTTTEDTKLSITDLAVADAEMDTLTVTLSVNNGTINLPNINTATNITAIDADGLDGSITFSGMADDINLMLDEGVDFYAAANANGNGYATLTMTTSDGTADDVVNTATINVTAVNDAPTFDIHSGAFSSSFVGEDTDGTYYSDEYASCNASALLPDGSIINVGDTTIDGTTYVSLLKLGNDGLPDSTFGEDESGHMVLDTSIFNDGGSATSVAVRPDGQIVISGYLDSGSPFFAILESDGSLDESYDITYSNNLPENEALDTNILYLDKVALQADGKIVLVGGQNPNGGNGGDVVLMRYNADGTVDTDFGTGGAIVTDLGNADSSSDVVIDTSGNIFVAVGGGDNSDMGIVKYTSSGVLDTDFGTDGIAWTGIENNAEAGAIKIDANGKIVLAGSFDGTYDNSDIALARFNANGILDESFGTNGTTIFNTDDIMDGYGGDDFANSLEIDASGAIYVGGEFGFYGENDEGYEGSASFKSVAKFGSDGTLDTGFAQGGMIIPEYVDDGYIIVDTQAQEAYDDDYWDSDNDPHGESGSINSILIQADGKIVMGGSYSYIDNYDYVYDYSGMSVSRIDANGNFDTYNFGYENDTVYNSDTDDFAEGGDAVTIGGSNWSWLTPSVYDVEQHAANNYSSGTLTIHRAGGANGEDLIRFDTSVNSAMTLVGITLEGTSATTGNIKHGGSTFATFNTNATDNEASTDGQLVINFTSSETAATQTLVNALTASISYDNTNDVNPAYDEGEVELSWLYNDGDEQETTSSCYISIEGDDDGGIEGTVAVIGTPTTGTTLSITGLDTITDPDLVTDENEDGTVPEDDLSFQWQVSSDSGETWENIDGAYDSTFEVTEIESGKEIRVVVGYEDPTNGSYTEIQSDTAGEGGEDNGGGGNSGGGDNGGGSTPTVPTTPTTPPATTTTVDGTTVQTTTTTQTRTTTDTNGHTTATTVSTEQIVIAPVTSNRTEQTGSTTTADVPLFWGESTRTEWATTASIPTGVGLTSEGSRAPAQTQTAQTVLDDLIYYIDTTTPSTDIGKTNMLNGGLAEKATICFTAEEIRMLRHIAAIWLIMSLQETKVKHMSLLHLIRMK